MAGRPGTYQTPTVLDFERNLDTIVHNGEQEARAAIPGMQSELAARGLARSGAAIKVIIENADKIHADTLDRCMNLIGEFSKVGSQLSLKALAETTRTRLESLETALLAAVPDAGSPKAAQQVRTQYAAVFQRRLGIALKDIEIGFINGRRITAPADEEPPKLGDAMIMKPSFMGMGVDIPKALRWVQSISQRLKR